MGYKPIVENAITILKGGYEGIRIISKGINDSLFPGHKLDGLVLDAGGYYIPNGISYGTETAVSGIFFSRGSSSKGYGKLNTKRKLEKELRRRPTDNGQELYGIGLISSGIHWDIADNYEERARLIIQATRLDKEDPLYSRTKKPSSKDKEWARIYLSELGNELDFEDNPASPEEDTLIERLSDSS